MSERKKIIWLVSWYPNKYDAFDGDFIQRHARAAALHDDIHVFFIKQCKKQIEIEETCNKRNGLTEQIIYLPKQKGLYGKWKNYRQWREVWKAQLTLLIAGHKPDLIHVHIPWKAGLIALWIKKRYQLPYIVTEHWGIYNHIAEDNIHTKSIFFRSLLKHIYKNANAFVSVSSYLGAGVNSSVARKEFRVIPNVVDTSLFYLTKQKSPRFTFLHVSNMVSLKNVEGILKAFYNFLQTGVDAQLILIGNRDDQYELLAKEYNLPPSTILFKGEIPYAEVAKEMQAAHVLVVNSNIENSPCVIGEALCCGLPVIATHVGGIPELVDSQNGILVPPKNDDALKNALCTAYEHYSRFNIEQIHAAAIQKFSTAEVSSQFHNLYNETVSRLPGKLV